MIIHIIPVLRAVFLLPGPAHAGYML